MTKVTKVVLGWGVTKHDASFWPTFSFDSEEIFSVRKVIILVCHLRVEEK